MEKLFLFLPTYRHHRGAGEEKFEVRGRASGVGLDEIDEVGIGLLKDRLLGCMGQVLQEGVLQG